MARPADRPITLQGSGFLDVGGSPLPHAITGDVATTALGLDLGYRLYF